ncbi:hypothetical protein BDR26DRAFT_311940 [Obelidium mucronatum]|nr:hypothetical protein BDR26DRAFT_311940 [Obelidium mucronatum]
MSPADYLHIITNPDIELTDHLTLRGEKATWPKIPLIQNHVRIEMCIDKAIYRLKSKQFGSSNTNLASPASQKECGFFESGESSCAESPALDALRATISRGSLDTLTDLAANLQGREKKRQSLLLRTESAL